MFPLDDPRWRELKGGYRIPYDASVALRKLELGEDVWSELWNELHHQGDVGDASYASVPHLVRIGQVDLKRDWNLYGLAAIIEVERYRKSNPPLPTWLQTDYESAWNQLGSLALQDLGSTSDKYTIHAALSVVAIWRSELKLGALLIHFDASEIDELAEERLAWSDLYDAK